MDKDALKTAMMTSISDVLETMFFMPLDFVTDGSDTPAAMTGGIAATLTFNGPDKGFFALSLPESMARDICADFLGIDGQRVGLKDMTGTVQEMINMLAGNTLSLYDADVVFDLGVPESTAPETIAWEGSGIGEAIRLTVQTLSSQLTLAVHFVD